MANDTFYKLKIESQKLAYRSREHIRLEHFTDTKAKDVVVIEDPYPHIVVENFFKPDIYQSLCEQFNEVKRRGFIDGKASPTQFHRFDIDYDGYVYTPPATLDPDNSLSVFFSLEMNAFFSKIFKQFTTFQTIFAFHHHPIGDRTGFVHHDNAVKSFSSHNHLANGVIYGDGEPSDMKGQRIIAILYYLNNAPWKEGDGGETGIYSSDGKTLLKLVPPINNTLFAFHISPHSMHAFQQNHVERNSMIQWFHIPPTL